MLVITDIDIADHLLIETTLITLIQTLYVPFIANVHNRTVVIPLRWLMTQIQQQVCSKFFRNHSSRRLSNMRPAGNSVSINFGQFSRVFAPKRRP